MSLHIPRLRGTGLHRAVDEVDHLRHQLKGAGLLIAGLRQQAADARAAEDRANAKANRLGEIEIRAEIAEAEAAAMRAELTALRAFKANATATSVPAGRRDIDPDDQPTQPIHVMPLWQALGVGPVRPVTDPGQTSWGQRNQEAGVA